jgi:1,2-diacylglycerol 3-beta-galactosyltransferase
MADQATILLLFSDTGGGHRSAAEAVAEAFQLEFPGRYRIDLVDGLRDYAPAPINRFTAWYPYMVRFPRAWGAGFRLSDGPRQARVMTSAAWPYVRRSARRILRERPAQAVVSVHPLLTTPVIQALGRQPAAPFVTVVTDLVSTHALWYDRRARLCLVPTAEAGRRALRCGMRPDRVRVIGLPVSERFARPGLAALEARRELGWPLDRPMVLLVGGGEGMGPLAETARAIGQRAGGYGLALIAGRNERLRAEMAALDWPIPTFVYGFERRIPEMMRAASLLVTKAGPGTISEALIAGLPMVLYSRLPGQEEGNVRYVVEQEVGVWAPGAAKTAAAVHHWLERPEALEQAARRCREVARPDAARAAVRTIDRLLTRAVGSREDCVGDGSEVGDDVAEHVPDGRPE